MSTILTVDLSLKVFGWRASLFYGDAGVWERWVWLRSRLRGGPLRTLDAGCGTGAFTFAAAAIGNNAVGVSHDARNNAEARRRAAVLGLWNVDFVDLDLRALDDAAIGMFDQVLCLETAEHILDDRKLFADLAARLRLGGSLFVTVPSIDVPPDGLVSDTEDGNHVRHGYSEAGLFNLLLDCGLIPAAASRISGTMTRRAIHTARRYARLGPVIRLAASLPYRVLRSLDHAPFSTLAVEAHQAKER